MTKYVIWLVGGICIIVGVFFGLKPVTSYEETEFSLGEKVECGSAWAPRPNGDNDLTTFGKASCAKEGINSNRTISFVALGIGALLVVGTFLIPDDQGAPARGTVPQQSGPAPARRGDGIRQGSEEKVVGCPRCAESIKAAAVVCRFCGFEFPDGFRADGKPVGPPTADAEGRCLLHDRPMRKGYCAACDRAG